jgi:hypothetical protein
MTDLRAVVMDCIMRNHVDDLNEALRDVNGATELTLYQSSVTDMNPLSPIAKAITHYPDYAYMLNTLLLRLETRFSKRCIVRICNRLEHQRWSLFGLSILATTSPLHQCKLQAYIEFLKRVFRNDTEGLLNILARVHVTMEGRLICELDALFYGAHYPSVVRYLVNSLGKKMFLRVLETVDCRMNGWALGWAYKMIADRRFPHASRWQPTLHHVLTWEDYALDIRSVVRHNRQPWLKHDQEMFALLRPSICTWSRRELQFRLRHIQRVFAQVRQMM